MRFHEPSPGADTYQPSRYDDPSATLWSAYLSKSQQWDRRLVENWKGDMDSILIFAGLFSASLTAFLVESYKTLNPDPEDDMVILLSQLLSSQLAASSNSSFPSGIHSKESFSVPASAIICNTLWFLSLTFSLLCALSATLVEQWARIYIHAINGQPAPQDRARLSAYLFSGIKEYGMTTIVETIPLLLHTSLFLFLAGLVAFLSPVNSFLQYMMLFLLTISSLLYFSVSIIPILQLECPYQTPLSSFCWFLLVKFQLLHRKDADGRVVPVKGSMATARELEATDPTPERDTRDLKAMAWTLSNLREDTELEAFVQVIPSIVSGFDFSAKLLIEKLLTHHDITIRLPHQIPRLLATCSTGLLEPSSAKARATTCLKAIWSLTMLSIPKGRDTLTSDPVLFRSQMKFKEDTFDLLNNVSQSVEGINSYILSAAAVFSRSLLDMHMERAKALECELQEMIENDPTTPSLDKQNGVPTTLHNEQFMEVCKVRLQVLTKEISEHRNMVTPLPFVLMESIASHQVRVLSIVRGDPGANTNRKLIQQTLHMLQDFQRQVNQASFHLALHYIARTLQAEYPPHEASNTLRRILFRTNFNGSFTKSSQECVVTYLEEAVDILPTGTTRLPHAVISSIIDFTRGLSDIFLLAKSQDIIKRYMKTVPDQDDTASRALVRLQKLTPDVPAKYQPLDLFAYHLSADAKPNKERKLKATTRSRSWDW